MLVYLVSIAVDICRHERILLAGFAEELHVVALCACVEISIYML